MNSATIRRGTGGGRAATSRSGGRRAPRKKSGLDRALDMLPFSRSTLARMLTAVVGLLTFAALWLAATFLGLPEMARMEAARLAANLGFEVGRIEVKGLKRMEETPVYALALDEIDRSMLNVDLVDVRRRIMTLGWVADARVTRRLPDALVIDITERQPVAVWQHGGQLSLIDAEGVVLETIDARAMPDLPLVIGPQANRRTRALQSLMEAAPALRPLLAGATWVGNRRWDLRFQSGETLLLPEGRSNAAAALMKFAQMEGVNRLLGRGIVRFDMRDPSRFVLRMPPDRAAVAPAGGEMEASGTPPDQADDAAVPDIARSGARSGEA